MQARDVEVGQSQRQPVILEPLGDRHPSSDSLVTPACLQTNDHSRRLVVTLNILRDTPDEVVGCASLVHILYHSTVTHEQTTHAVTHRKARDNSELTWVSWGKVVPGGCIGSVGMYQPAALIEAVPRISLSRCTVKMHQRPTL